MGPGEISCGVNQNAKETEDRGHLSSALGDKPAMFLLIQFESVPPGLSPSLFPKEQSRNCRLRTRVIDQSLRAERGS
jgi:hypothetical protein